jgi:23S rRNA pseudouridine955/2504/2580 synthase
MTYSIPVTDNVYKGCITIMASVEQKTVTPDEAGMRLDRWFKLHYPGFGFAPLQKLLRSGQVRVNGGRVKAETRLLEEQIVRIPPLSEQAPTKNAPLTGKTIRGQNDADVLKQMVLFEDEKVIVFNKPAGLSVQGGSGVMRNVDDMLEAWRNKKGEKPRLVHRIDRDTAGCLVVARTRGAAQFLTQMFRERETGKTYWALVKGAPRFNEGKVSSWLLKEKTPDGDKMRVCEQGVKGADHAVSHYQVIENVGQRVSWIKWTPHTGRTHQLRVHSLQLGCPIIGDPKYFEHDTNWDFPGGIQNKLHLLARRIVIPHPNNGMIDVTAPLPPHMLQSFNLLGLEEKTGNS